MRLGPLNAQSNKYAPTESQLHFACTEVVPAPCKIVNDAVGISDVPGSSGINVKPPNLLLTSAESGNVAALAFDYDLMRRMDDENATVVRGNSTGNADGLAC
jgi:hypothetical protein